LESSLRKSGAGPNVQTRPGELGQFDVVVDGKVVASRRRSVLASLLGGGWPTADEVLQAIERGPGAPGA
jgi:hypothetical protein